jgi:hypothetical protein
MFPQHERIQILEAETARDSIGNYLPMETSSKRCQILQVCSHRDSLVEAIEVPAKALIIYKVRHILQDRRADRPENLQGNNMRLFQSFSCRLSPFMCHQNNHTTPIAYASRLDPVFFWLTTRFSETMVHTNFDTYRLWRRSC